MNAREKRKLSQSWELRDFRRNRRFWHRLPMEIGSKCYVLLLSAASGRYQVEEGVFAGVTVKQGRTVYAAVVGIQTHQILPSDLFDNSGLAYSEAERRNKETK